MADFNENCTGNEFREACCIDAGRVYDSCCDRDCLEDLRIYFTEAGQELIATAASIKVRSAEVVSATVDIEPVNFNRGFYTSNITFYIILNLDVCEAGACNPTALSAAACYTKRVILYGSEGNVKVFTTAINPPCACTATADATSNAPRCVVQCVDPIVLSSRVGVVREGFDTVCAFPAEITEILGGEVVVDLPAGSPAVYVTLGLFTTIQLIRQVQMLVPVYDFCIPEKHCIDSADQPCDVFRRIKFPTDDFFPPKLEGNEGSFGCQN
ncbi:MAG: hypothetical protein IKK13_00250 [Clostridia bacterium]|nr:hypothetical protein [Clostridia bacterium]